LGKLRKEKCDRKTKGKNITKNEIKGFALDIKGVE
jgi:hypothetical protein